MANIGWVDRGIGTAQNSRKLPDAIPTDKHSMGLGVLGMPGYDTYIQISDRKCCIVCPGGSRHSGRYRVKR